MRNKFLLSFLFCVLIHFVNAQELRLQKNGRLKIFKIKLPKRLSIEYETDSGNIKYAGKVFKYEFPFLYMKKKSDTLFFDVRKIESLNYTSSAFVLYLLGGDITTMIAIANVYGFIAGRYYYFPAILIFPYYFTTLTVKQFNAAHRVYDTKTQWSFY